jgi:CheY-like chemotaxis protein
MRNMTAKKAEEGATLPIKDRILEVSDSEVLREYIAAICERRGFDVIQARCGDEALQLYRKCGPFVLVLTDLHWHDDTTTIRDGIQLALAIRKVVPEQKIVIHTSDSEETRVQMPKELSDIPILQKPFRLRELIALLENWGTKQIPPSTPDSKKYGGTVRRSKHRRAAPAEEAFVALSRY